ncbi:TIGR02452 family protein [Amycolatopsis sp. NPDC001370]|uniref:TIGR02452 family protein n=1 Tax=Amycolatopsis sp. NPDC001370 TaxID=3363923 RepID=UPI0036C352D7
MSILSTSTDGERRRGFQPQSCPQRGQVVDNCGDNCLNTRARVLRGRWDTKEIASVKQIEPTNESSVATAQRQGGDVADPVELVLDVPLLGASQPIPLTSAEKNSTEAGACRAVHTSGRYFRCAPTPVRDTIAGVSSRLRNIATETVEIVERGAYGGVVIRDLVENARKGTWLYLPDDKLPEPVKKEAPSIEVTNESSIAAARRLGGDVACLVFASARNPGGGFLNGAQAQEEAIARSSALYACLLEAREFYEYHRANTDLRYSDRVIHSPGVPVFRDDHGALLPEATSVSFLTAAAPNLGAIKRNQPEHEASVPAVLERRAERVVEIAASRGHRRLVLGAWGCGVFENDPAVVAGAFRKALDARPHFEHVTFAVLDRRAGEPVYAAFARTFGR